MDSIYWFVQKEGRIWGSGGTEGCLLSCSESPPREENSPSDGEMPITPAKFHTCKIRHAGFARVVTDFLSGDSLNFPLD